MQGLSLAVQQNLLAQASEFGWSVKTLKGAAEPCRTKIQSRGGRRRSDPTLRALKQAARVLGAAQEGAQRARPRPSAAEQGQIKVTLTAVMQTCRDLVAMLAPSEPPADAPDR